MEKRKICVLLGGFIPFSTRQYGAVGLMRRNLISASSFGALEGEISEGRGG
jgi:hypothetical protein